MSEHTPTPWELNPADRREIIAPSEVMFITKMPDSLYMKRAPANAAFIVKAVNCHDELVSALSRIMHYAHTGASVCDVHTDEQPEFVNAKAALAKAGAS